MWNVAERRTNIFQAPPIRAFIALLALVVLVILIVMPDRHAPTTVAPEFQVATVEYVIDGDTLDVDIDGRTHRVRLTGVDAPESVNRNEDLNSLDGERAADFVRALVPEKSTVYLQKDVSDTERYGRLLRYVWLEMPDDPDDFDEVANKMLNAIVVENGHAVPRAYEPDTRYAHVFAALAGESYDDYWYDDYAAGE